MNNKIINLNLAERFLLIIGGMMLTFILWLILLFFCWPIAIFALVAYPFIWLLLLPFRLLGIVVGGVFEFLTALITLPARILRGPTGIK